MPLEVSNFTYAGPFGLQNMGVELDLCPVMFCLEHYIVVNMFQKQKHNYVLQPGSPGFWGLAARICC